jgi:HAT1-interacting factor 1
MTHDIDPDEAPRVKHSQPTTTSPFFTSNSVSSTPKIVPPNSLELPEMSVDDTAPAPVASAASSQDQLAELIAQATAAYAIKDYAPAADFYSEATEIQAEINGEMAVENADLLYSYGKCLYFLAIKNSEVLGGGAAGAKMSAKPEAKNSKKRKANSESSRMAGTKTMEEATPGALVPDAAANPGSDAIPGTDVRPGVETASEEKEEKPYFQFEGDGDFGDSDEEGEGEDANAEDEEEEDDFANAFEVLDLSRVLLLRKLEQMEQNAQEDSDKGKSTASVDLTPEMREVKIRIADIHDLEAEISFESEKFDVAVEDLKSSLALKEELYTRDSSLLAECHYKLSLALDFSSRHQEVDKDGNPVGKPTFDQAMRDDAAEQMEKAIESCNLRISKEEKELDAITDQAKKDKAVLQIEDVKEMVGDMEQRLTDLRNPPIDVNQQSGIDLDTAGILKEILGGKTTLDEVVGQANDLSGMVKRKKPKVETPNGGAAATTPIPAQISTKAVNGNGKRKVAFDDEVQQVEVPKRAKVEDAEDSGL